MERESIVFYRSFRDAIQNLPEEHRVHAYDAVLNYAFDGIEYDGEDQIAMAIYMMAKPNIDSAAKKYEASVENGKKGGRPKSENPQKPNNNPNKTQAKPKS